jgi:hypothetical protein
MKFTENNKKISSSMYVSNQFNNYFTLQTVNTYTKQ